MIAVIMRNENLINTGKKVANACSSTLAAIKHKVASFVVAPVAI
jgi:hypothetical protein